MADAAGAGAGAMILFSVFLMPYGLLFVAVGDDDVDDGKFASLFLSLPCELASSPLTSRKFEAVVLPTNSSKKDSFYACCRACFNISARFFTKLFDSISEDVLLKKEVSISLSNFSRALYTRMDCFVRSSLTHCEALTSVSLLSAVVCIASLFAFFIYFSRFTCECEADDRLSVLLLRLLALLVKLLSDDEDDEDEDEENEADRFNRNSRCFSR